MTNMYTIGFLLRRELPVNEDLAHRDTTLKNGNAEIFYKGKNSCLPGKVYFSWAFSNTKEPHGTPMIPE